MCLAVKPPPFDKGGKDDGAKQGIVRFWKGCAERGLMEWHPLRQLPEFLWATAPHLWQGTGTDAL
ncbi:MAG TPA: hypothetical protein DIW32_06335 [Eubacterium sp.]|nr:hypothetical protein [Eubacterium sp.]